MSRIQKGLCAYDELPNPGSKGLTITIDDVPLNIFIVKKAKKIFVYENSCPHTLGPLD